MAASYFVYVMSMTYKHFAYFQIVKDLIRSYIIAEGQAIPVIVNNIKLIFKDIRVIASNVISV